MVLTKTNTFSIKDLITLSIFTLENSNILVLKVNAMKISTHFTKSQPLSLKSKI